MKVNAIYFSPYYSGYGAAGHGGYAHDGPRYHGPQAIPVVLPDGHIADTHEVAAAKGAHLAAVAKAQAHGHGYGGDYDGYSGGYGANGYAAGVNGYAAGAHGYAAGAHGYAAPYHGPIAKPVVLSSGYLADTHDVAALKGAHLNALAHASHGHEGWAPHGHGYH